MLFITSVLRILTMNEPDVKYYLDGWHIYPEKLAIERDNQLVHLEPKIMEVLVYILKNANRVVSREELTEEVWQTRFASDEVITRAISVLRKKLNDTGKVHKLIKTIPKHGYVLEWLEPLTETAVDASIEDHPAVNGIEPMINRLISPMVAIIIAVTSIAIVISVLGLQFFSERKHANQQINIQIDDFVASDNLTTSAMVARVLSEQLITTLSNSESVKISINHDISSKITNNIAGYIIGGGVKEVNSEYHVNLHFINANSGDVLWSQSFAGEKENWHLLINNISSTILYFIGVAYEEKLDLSQLSLKNLQAAILIHQARELRNDGSPDNFKIAINLLQNALLTYPDEEKIIYELALSYFRSMSLFGSENTFAQVQALLRQAEQQNNHQGLYWLIKALVELQENNITLAEAIALAEKSETENSNNSEVIGLLGHLYLRNNQLVKAEQQFNRAFQLNSDFSYAVYQLAILKSQQGNNLQAISLVQSQLTKQPENLNLSLLLAQLYLSNGRFSDAISFFKQMDLQQQRGRLKQWLVISYFYLHSTEQAINYLQQLDVSGATNLQYKRQCQLLTLQGSFEQATESCRLADKANNFRDRFSFARNLMLNKNYEQAKIEYSELFKQINRATQDTDPSKLLVEKAEFIWLLAKTGEQAQAKILSTALFNYFKDNQRNGYKGYGVTDVIILLALEEHELAFDAFDEALNQGWLHWYDWRYGGPHPALEQLQDDPRYPQWMSYIEQSLNLQRQKIDY